MIYLTAWRNGDLVRLNGEQFRLTSDGYEMKPGQIFCDTGLPISYLELIENAYLVETCSGRKNY